VYLSLKYAFRGHCIDFLELAKAMSVLVEAVRVRVESVRVLLEGS
jgi:hypothetical protein